MSKRNLKTYFETADIPTEAEFAEFIEFADIGRGLGLLNLKESTNLFNSEDADHGKYLGTSNGAHLFNTTLGSTGRIYVQPNRTLLISGYDPNFIFVHAYEKDGTWIGNLPLTDVGASKQCVTPANTYYVDCNLYDSSETQYADSFTIVDVKDVLLEVKELVQDKYFIESIDKPLLPNIIEPDTDPKELFAGHIDDFFINSADGVITQAAPWKITEKIYVTVGETYSVTGYTSRFDVHAYDIDGNWLGFVAANGTGTKLFTPSDANTHYVQCNIAQTAAHANVVNTLSITGVSPQSFRIKQEYLSAAPSGGTAYDQSLNTTDDVEFNSLSVEALSFNASVWDETGTPPIPVGQAYLFDNGTHYEVRVRKT